MTITDKLAVMESAAIASILNNGPRDIQAMKDDAWAGLVSDLLLGSTEDKNTAKARYERKMATIAALEQETSK